MAELTDRELWELRAVLHAQDRTLKALESALGPVEEQLSDARVQREQLAQLELLMAELEASADLLEPGDMAGFDAASVLALYERRHQTVQDELARRDYRDWHSLVRRCQLELLREGVDPFAPYEALLEASDWQHLRDQSYEAQYRWDAWDYVFVGASGILAALCDFLLVRVPRSMTYQAARVEGSPLTDWLKKRGAPGDGTAFFTEWAQELESRCKAPYDQLKLRGMYPRSHRLQSFGHDPVLGFVFGVLDILKGTVTGFSYDHLTGAHSFVRESVSSGPAAEGLIEAILLQVGHLLSDVATPQGLPAPFLGLLQGLNVGSFGEKGRSVGQLARWMYLNGYDLRHFIASGLSPGCVELLLRAYLMLRHYAEHGDAPFRLASNPKYRSMLLMAHGIAAAANAGKVMLQQGNPLAINQAQWMAFFRYLIPSVKYWVFDRRRLRLEHMDRIAEQNWTALEENGRRVLEAAAFRDAPVIVLGDSGKMTEQ